MKKEGISQIANLLGVSNEMVRKYEKKNLLRVKRNKENQYREFDSCNVSSLIWNRKMMASGFSMSQVSSFIEGADVKQIVREAEKRKAEITSEMNRLKELLSSLCEWEKELAQYEIRGLDQYSVETRPSIRMCTVFGEDGSLLEPEQLKNAKAWMPHITQIFQGYCVPTDRHLLKNTIKFGGLCMKTDSMPANLKLPYDHALPQQLCITSYCMGSEGDPITREKMLTVIQDIENRGYKIAAEAFVEVVLVREVQGEHCYLQKIWVPIWDAEQE